METLLLGLAVVTLAYLLPTILECVIGFKTIKNLPDQVSLPVEKLPPVSIIFSALNEENVLEETLLSLLKLDYPNLEIIAINDRSTDNTPIILEKIQSKHPNLRVFHIHHLPNGWLGKNHALHFASQYAKGDWLLFTDADVLMKGPVAAKAISYALENKLDHLTIYENHLPKQFLLKILLLGHYVAYSMEMKPWRIRYAWSKKYLGHGAFNLVNKASYLKCGGHPVIAMECLDDMKLGQLIKKNGYKQDVMNGKNLVEREWYSSFGAMVKGLQKNSFAHFNFKLSAFMMDFIFAIFFFIWPFIGAIFFDGPIRWVNLINISLTLFLSGYVAAQFRLQKRFAFFYPVAISMLLYTVWNSIIATYKNNGIIWRDTHYPLESLKNKKF